MWFSMDCLGLVAYLKCFFVFCPTVSMHKSRLVRLGVGVAGPV